MSLDSGEDTNRSQNYFLELVDFLDKQGRVLAKDLHETRYIYNVFALLDGLYLYVGVLNLALLMPPAFIAMTVVCCIYILANVLSRIYEEYVDQLELRIAQNTCKLAQVTKDLQSIYTNLLFLQEKEDKNPDDFAKIKKLQEQFCERMKRIRRETADAEYSAI